MNIEMWLGFVVASSIVLTLPGPTILIVIGYSITHGKRAHLPLLAAVTLADIVVVGGSLLGLGALLSTSAFWFTVVKWIGGLYLLYLGISLLRSGASSVKISETKTPDSRWKLFVNTFIVTTLNPKTIVFILAFMPQFINPVTNTSSQLWVLAITFIVLATAIVAVYAVFASSASSFLSSARTQRHFNNAGGSMLLIAGIWTLFAKRPLT